MIAAAPGYELAPDSVRGLVGVVPAPSTRPDDANSPIMGIEIGRAMYTRLRERCATEVSCAQSAPSGASCLTAPARALKKGSDSIATIVICLAPADSAEAYFMGDTTLFHDFFKNMISPAFRLDSLPAAS